MKKHHTVGLKQQVLISLASGHCKSKVKVTEDGRGALSGSDFCLCSLSCLYVASGSLT